MTTHWNKPDRPLILASRSPRRKEILTTMGLSFSVYPPTIENEEHYIEQNDIYDSIQNLALAKAQTVAELAASSLILGSDTVVVINDQIIGKPADDTDARDMLKRLSGTVHKVYSGVALVCAEINFKRTVAACTEVTFRAVADWEIDEYLMHEEYSDKAGAYAIQGKAMTFIDRIQGCFYNVMGLPITETIALFKAYTSFPKGSS